MIRIAALLLLAGCAAQDCKQAPAIQTVVQGPPRVVTRTIVVHDPGPRRGSVLLKAYRSSEKQQDQLARKGTIPAIQKLTQLRLAVRRAFIPLQAKDHKPTDAEVQQAVTAYGALQAFINEPHAVRTSP